MKVSMKRCYKTKSGLAVRLLCVDREVPTGRFKTDLSKTETVIGLVMEDDGERLGYWNKDGVSCFEHPSRQEHSDNLVVDEEAERESFSVRAVRLSDMPMPTQWQYAEALLLNIFKGIRRKLDGIDVDDSILFEAELFLNQLKLNLHKK